MKLSKDQIESLVKMVASAETDESDCDSCFEHLAEFAETELSGKEIPEALRAVDRHIKQCDCCRAEYDALVAGLKAIADE
jgi:predicted anti-sigma-YlaC factor YlaD